MYCMYFNGVRPWSIHMCIVIARECIDYAFRTVTNILTNHKVHQGAKPKPYYLNHYYNKGG